MHASALFCFLSILPSMVPRDRPWGNRLSLPCTSIGSCPLIVQPSRSYVSIAGTTQTHAIARNHGERYPSIVLQASRYSLIPCCGLATGRTGRSWRRHATGGALEQALSARTAKGGRGETSTSPSRANSTGSDAPAKSAPRSSACPRRLCRGVVSPPAALGSRPDIQRQCGVRLPRRRHSHVAPHGAHARENRPRHAPVRRGDVTPLANDRGGARERL
jgi:hypothetical protein